MSHSQYMMERRLCACYWLLALLLGLAALFAAVPYLHWRNYLENVTSKCLYAIFAPIPILVYAIVMALFHMCRVCIKNIGKYEDERSTFMQEYDCQSKVVTSRARVSQHNECVIYCWIPSASIAAIFCVYNIIHAAIVTYGVIKTCNQYRNYLVTDLPAPTELSSAILCRLSCQAIFDCMDYIEKNATGTNNHGVYINTGVLLHMVIIASWASVAIWIAIVVLTSIRAYKERNVLKCCGRLRRIICCCCFETD